MAFKKASLVSLFRRSPTTLTQTPPKTPSSSMPKRKHSHSSSSRPTPRTMDDSDDHFAFFRRQDSPQPSTSLVAFYDGTGTDGRGRTLEQILEWRATRLEQSHDYIQTLFPLPEASGVNFSAPLIDKQVFEAFHQRPELRRRLRDAFIKMLWFYGFELIEEEEKLSVRPGSNFKENSKHWKTRFDHNHLRITRIIRCLRILGLEGEAQAFYDTVSCETRVSPMSRMYWGRAMSRPLNVAPDVDDEDAGGQDDVGPKFLRDFDSEKEKVKTALLKSKEEHDVQKPIKQSTPETEDYPGTKNTLGEPKEKADVDIRSGVSEQSEAIDTLKEETGDVKQG